MTTRFPFARLLLAASLLATPVLIAPPALAQEQNAPAGIAMELPVDAAALAYRSADGRKGSFQVEIADTPERHARGLMFRTDLPADRGMLFVFENSRVLSFWMQNTPLPLDLVFIDEAGVVIDVLPGEPFSTASISPGEPGRFVLELHRGTAAQAGIGPGTRFSHPAIDAVH